MSIGHKVQSVEDDDDRWHVTLSAGVVYGLREDGASCSRPGCVELAVEHLVHLNPWIDWPHEATGTPVCATHLGEHQCQHDVTAAPVPQTA